jgi:streptomycin 6-kinase
MHDYATAALARLPQQSAALRALGVLRRVEQAIDDLETLAAGATEAVLLHGDYNPGNILQSADSWVVVDPKPLVGDPAYDLWPLVTQIGAPYSSANPAATLERQVALAAEASAVDPGRAAAWSFARTGLNVSWYLHDGEPALAAENAVALGAWAEVIAPA